jgi:hypothetical protein
VHAALEDRFDAIAGNAHRIKAVPGRTTYHMLRDGTCHHDLGAGYLDTINKGSVSKVPRPAAQRDGIHDITQPRPA